MDYLEAIEKGFSICDEIDMELRLIGKQSDNNHTFAFDGEKLTVEADDKAEKMETKFEITIQEVKDNVLRKEESIQEAICNLLKEKTCEAASRYKN